MEATTEPDFYAVVGEWVPLHAQEANIFARRLQRYMEEQIPELEITSVDFRLVGGEGALPARVKKERRRDNTVVDVVESIGGPEIRLYVNGIRVITWMTLCDHFTADTLDIGFDEIAQVTLLALTGSWDLHDVTICCSRWGEEKSKTIVCCTDTS